MRISRGIILVLSSVLVLGACSSAREKDAEVVISNFSIVDDYAYDKVKVIVEEEKTPEQVAKELLLAQMNLSVTIPNMYPEYGVDKDNGIFVNSAILDGPNIPTEPGFDKASALAGQTNTGLSQDEIIGTFEDLQRARAIAAAKQEQEQEVNIANDIQRRLLEQQEQIQQQQEQKQLQDELFGTGQGFTVTDTNN